jgi:hypothetical protein
MTSRIIAIVPLLSLVFVPAASAAQGPVTRYALAVGANFGGPDRPELRYAVSDAEHFVRVLEELGGVPPERAVVLRQPSLRELVRALDELRSRIAATPRGSGRTEVLVYYSGHADEKGLLLGDDRYSYTSLRSRLDEIPADVRIAVLDACASGAFTRLKGGRRRPAFLVDEPSDMHGHAFLTSSSETEAAQESDGIGGSYFTYYLISGLRGAADLSGEGTVTLNEAYQFAFNETLGRTMDTRGGAQHPSYDINLSGTGDVVITDLRQTTATLVLASDVDGRVFVRDAAGRVVLELYKPRGRAVSLALDPGHYDVRVERPPAVLGAGITIAEDGTTTLDAARIHPIAGEPTRRRGRVQPMRFAVAGRNRLALRIGAWFVPDGTPHGYIVRSGARVGNLAGGFEYTRFMSERLAVTFGATVRPNSAGSVVTTDGVFSGSSTVVVLPVGVRWNPGRGDYRMRPVKPYLAFGLGPVIGSAAGSSVTWRGASAGASEETALGGHVGGGVDLHLGRGCSFGLGLGYNWMTNFAEPIGGRRNYSGVDFSLSLGWIFGKGDATRR